MSFRHTRSALDDPYFTARDKVKLLVALVLAGYASDKDDRAWPSIDTISREARASVRAVHSAIREMQKDGKLSVSFGCGRMQTNIYQLHFINPANERIKPCNTVFETLQTDVSNPAIHDINPANERHPFAGGGCNPRHETLQSSGATLHPNQKEPKELSRESSSFRAVEPPTPEDEERRRMLRWWPEQFQKNVEFQRAWEEWESHCAEKSRPHSSSSRRLQLMTCDRLGQARAILVLAACIERNITILDLDAPENNKSKLSNAKKTIKCCL